MIVRRYRLVLRVDMVESGNYLPLEWAADFADDILGAESDDVQDVRVESVELVEELPA